MNIDELEARVKAAEKNGLIKINISHDGDMEGVWAYPATPEDKEIYNLTDSYGKVFEVFLVNQALIGCKSWGARLRVTTNGNQRPIVSAAHAVEQIQMAGDDYPSPQTFEEYYQNQGE